MFWLSAGVKVVPLPPMKPTRLPEGAWQEIAADMLGPLPNGEYLLVMVDYFSRSNGEVERENR